MGVSLGQSSGFNPQIDLANWYLIFHALSPHNKDLPRTYIFHFKINVFIK